MLGLLLLLVGCTNSAYSTLTPTPRTCGGFVLPDASVTCAQVGERTQRLAAQGQVTLRDEGVTLVFNDTVDVLRDDSRLLVTLLQGSATLSAQGRTHILAPGDTVSLALVQASRTPGDPVQDAATALPSATDCAPREDWALYTVQPGDTLTAIAQRHDLTLTEIAAANCVDDPSRLQVGQVLRVPASDEATLTPAAGLQVVSFRADTYRVVAGACTVLRWDVDNAARVILGEQTVPLRGFQQVCPESTREYVLRVIGLDEREDLYRVTIAVSGS